jgi:hypothetical protein
VDIVAWALATVAWDLATVTANTNADIAVRARAALGAG